MKATALRGTGVAIINDIGEPTDIHPKNKQDVVDAWLSSLVTWHTTRMASPGRVRFIASRPRRKSHARMVQPRGWLENSRGGPVKGFVIAGADGNFVAANAKIDGSTVDSVQFSSHRILRPCAMRGITIRMRIS